MYNQNFYGGGWGGGNSERCLKFGGGKSLRNFNENYLKEGWVKVEIVGKGRQF